MYTNVQETITFLLLILSNRISTYYPIINATKTAPNILVNNLLK